ncbi:MAG: hypothetical protein ABJM29_01730 [Rhizobiaceae bacterium]
MRKSKYQPPAQGWIIASNFTGPTQKTSDQNSSAPPIKSRLQRAMEAVDAQPDDQPQPHLLPSRRSPDQLSRPNSRPNSPPHASKSPAQMSERSWVSVEELMESELRAELSNSFELERQQHEDLCRDEERDIESAVETLKTLSRHPESATVEEESEASDIKTEGTKKVTDGGTDETNISSSQSLQKDKKARDEGVTRHDFSKPQSDAAVRLEMQDASFDRLLQVAPPLTLLLIVGVVSGMYAASDWWPEVQRIEQAAHQQKSGNPLPDQIVGFASTSAQSMAYAAESPLTTLRATSQNVQVEELAAPLKAQQINLSANTSPLTTMDEDTALTLQQRLDAWESEAGQPDKAVSADKAPAPQEPAEATPLPIEEVRIASAEPASVPVSNTRSVPTQVVDGAFVATRNVSAVRQVKPAEQPSLRPSHEVELALNAAMGLEQLSTSDRQRLKQELVLGKCTTTALSTVFDKVPILAIRDLRRSLGGDC